MGSMTTRFCIRVNTSKQYSTAPSYPVPAFNNNSALSMGPSPEPFTGPSTVEATPSINLIGQKVPKPSARALLRIRRLSHTVESCEARSKNLREYKGPTEWANDPRHQARVFTPRAGNPVNDNIKDITKPLPPPCKLLRSHRPFNSSRLPERICDHPIEAALIYTLTLH